MRRTFIMILIVSLIFIVGCQVPITEPVNEDVHFCTEEEKEAEVCTMEYALVCGDNMKTYSNGCIACSSEKIDYYVEGECELSIDEAMEIAQDSECVEKGTLTSTYIYNENSKTFWIDLEMRPEFEEENCNPACVVSVDSKKAEINWRCTGLIK